MKVKIKEIHKNVFHLKFAKQSSLAKTFIRFQEHFESPKFRGRIFTLKEMKKWYKKKNKGKFTYYGDYSGFNIPSSVLEKFYAGKFDPLDMRELWLLEQFKNIKGKFYIIGSYKEKKKKEADDTVRHELAHALFYINAQYRKEVLAILATVNTKPLMKALSKKKANYHESVRTDECHAYILCDLDWMRKTWKVKVGPYKQTHKQLAKVFKKYAA